MLQNSHEFGVFSCLILKLQHVQSNLWLPTYKTWGAEGAHMGVGSCWDDFFCCCLYFEKRHFTLKKIYNILERPQAAALWPFPGTKEE